MITFLKNCPKKKTVDKIIVKKDISSNKHSEFLNTWCR